MWNISLCQKTSTISILKSLVRESQSNIDISHKNNNKKKKWISDYSGLHLKFLIWALCPSSACILHTDPLVNNKCVSCSIFGLYHMTKLLLTIPNYVIKVYDSCWYSIWSISVSANTESYNITFVSVLQLLYRTCILISNRSYVKTWTCKLSRSSSKSTGRLLQSSLEPHSLDII